MKVLIDTNIIIDGLQSRKGFHDDAGLVMLQAYEYDGYIAASSITDIFYLQRKFFHDKQKARENLTELLKIYRVLDTTAEDCKNALRSNIADFEDAVLIESVMRAGLDAIVTRNKKDFQKSSINIYDPVEFLRVLRERK